MLDIGIDTLLVSGCIFRSANRDRYDVDVYTVPKFHLSKSRRMTQWAYGFGVFTPAGFASDFT